MIAAWSAFAKTGKPGWAQYEAKDKVIKEFNSIDSLRSGNDTLWSARTKYVDSIYTAIQSM